MKKTKGDHLLGGSTEGVRGESESILVPLIFINGLTDNRISKSGHRKLTRTSTEGNYIIWKAKI